MIILRDMIESDIEDYVRWFTRDTEWMNYDAPWEKEITDEKQEREAWTQYYQSVKEMPLDRMRWKFEIEYGGKHIGWVSSYYDLDYLENREKIPAIGIDIPETSFRDHGIGTEALSMFIDYFGQNGFTTLYIQSWSGNERMLHVAANLGFEPYCTVRDYRLVDGNRYDAVTMKLEL